MKGMIMWEVGLKFVNVKGWFFFGNVRIKFSNICKDVRVVG